MGDCEQVLVIKVPPLGMEDEWTLEDTGQRIVIIRQESEAAERNEILNGNVFAELDTVGAGDGNFLVMELAQYRIEEAIARPDQDQNVAGPDGTATRLDHPPFVEP